VAFCYVHKCELSYMCPGHDIKLHSTRSEIISNRVCELRIGIGEGANVIISKLVIRFDSRFLRLCNCSVLP